MSARVSQLTLEILVNPTSQKARVSQLVLEIHLDTTSVQSSDSINNWADSIGITAYIAASPLSRSVADNFEFRRKPTLLDYLGHKDVLLIQFFGQDYSIQITDVFTMDDDISHTNEDSLADSLSLSDSSIVSMSIAIEAYDSMFYTLVDSTISFNLISNLSILLSDTLILSDQLLIGGLIIILSVDDSISLADYFRAIFETRLTEGDFLQMIDTPEPGSDYLFFGDDTLLMADDIILSSPVFSSLSVSDSFTLSDSGVDSIETLINSSQSSYLRRYLNDVPGR